MRFSVPALFVGLLSIAPTLAHTQTVIVDPATMPEAYVVRTLVPLPQPRPAVIYGPPTLADAEQIAMASGVVAVDSAHRRWLDGNFEVEGTNSAGEDIEVVIDSRTGEVLSIDD